MQQIKDLLNQIRWDKRKKPEEYSVHYFDRVKKGLMEIKYNGIKRLEGTFMVIEKNSEETSIPLHRVRQVRRNGKLVWERRA